MPQDAIDLLLESDLLGGVPEERLRDLDPPPEWLSISSGDTLIEQGHQGESFYLLVHGRLRVFVADENGVARKVGEVLPGEGVGEMSLLTDDLTAATVRAMHDCELVRFSRDSYKQLMETSPEAALQVTRTVIKRLRAGLSGKPRRAFYRSIAVIPIDETVDAKRFAAMLQDQLATFSPASIVDPESLGAKFSHLLRSPEQLTPEIKRQIGLKLLTLEEENSVAVYPCDAQPTEWTQLCIRQADLLLLVSTVDSDVGLSDTETSLINHIDPDLAPRCDLVLLHPEEWRPHCGTRHWLEARKTSEYHHLRAWNEVDFARLARIVTGNSISLVLGGGGARGFAQIGVLRALTEAGIPIDRIAGTSMGSLIGAQIALGKSIDEITQISREVWIEGKPLSDYTFPALSIVRGRRLHNLIKHALHGWNVEDLPISFFCVSGNLTTTDLMLHEWGPLWEGIRASGSIPGAGPPMFLRGNILVDGGVLNNLPGDLMLERFGGVIVAVDVSPQDPMTVPEDIDEVPSGWRILWSKLNPFEEALHVPGIFELLYRTATLSSDRLAKQTYDRTDFLLVPPIGHFGILAFDKLDQIVDIGYRYTVARIRDGLDERIARYAQISRLPSLEEVRIERDRSPEKAEASGRRRRRVLRATAAALAAVLVVGGISMNRGLAPGRDKADTPAPANAALQTVTKYQGSNILPVEALAVRRTEGYGIKESYAGRVVSRRQSELGFERTGTLIEIAVDEGERVKEGQLLARLDVRSLQARRRELQADMIQSRATKSQTEARLNLAMATAGRRSELLKRDNVSRQSYDEAKFDAQALHSELAANTADIERVAALLQSLNVAVEKSSIRAPFDGTIVERKVDEGAAATAGTTVLRLIEDGVKEVRVGIPTLAMAHLVPGNEYEIEVDGKIHRCRLKALLASLNPETRTIPAIFEIEDPERALLSGQLAQLHLNYTVPMDGFWLPLNALVGGRRGLWNAYALVNGGEEGLMRTSRLELQMLYSDAERAYVRGIPRLIEKAKRVCKVHLEGFLLSA